MADKKKRKNGWVKLLALFVGLPLAILAVYYGYGSSEWEIREGVVAETMGATLSRGARKHGNTEIHTNFRLEGDTTTYGYSWRIKGRSASDPFIDPGWARIRGLREGDSVRLWVKTGERDPWVVYAHDKAAEEYNKYQPYGFRKVADDEAYVVGIRGLEVNGRVILRPQFHNYVSTENYHIMRVTMTLLCIGGFILAMTAIVAVIALVKHSPSKPRP